MVLSGITLSIIADCGESSLSYGDTVKLSAIARSAVVSSTTLLPAKPVILPAGSVVTATGVVELSTEILPSV